MNTESIAKFGTPQEDLKTIYILFVIDLLEQSAIVWHSSLSQEIIGDLERVHKSAYKVILQERYRGYKNALNTLDIETLADRRNALCLSFALKCTRNKKVSNLFPKNDKIHQMETRNPEVYKVQHANTERLKKSPVIYMQNLLNEHEKMQNVT